jgi:hypothetical protein
VFVGVVVGVAVFEGVTLGVGELDGVFVGVAVFVGVTGGVGVADTGGNCEQFVVICL